MQELKRIAQNANSFMANGTKYIVHGSLSVARFAKFEELQIEVGAGSDFNRVKIELEGVYNLMNQSKQADAAVRLFNLIESINRNVNKREHPALLLCTLFISKEGENLASWSEAEATEKIEDWKKEGIDAADFFQLAFGLVRGFMGSFGEDSPSFSTKAEATSKVD